MYAWLFNEYIDKEMKDVKIWMGKMGAMVSDVGRKRKLSDLLCSDDLVLCAEPEKALRVTIKCFFKVRAEY